MEERVLQELKALAQSIIDTNNPDWNGLLSDAQLLYERLLILNYLREENLIETVVEKSESAIPEPQPQAQALEKPAETVKTEPEPIEEPKPVQPVPTTQEKPVEESNPAVEEREEISPAPKSTPVLPPEVIAEKRPDTIFEAVDPKPRNKSSLNDRLAVGQIQIGLNDRIAFVKHLFNGEQGDFNRVLSQLNTFEQMAEAENFIEQMVKPDYDWSQKEEFELRFYDLVRQKFGEE